MLAALMLAWQVSADIVSSTPTNLVGYNIANVYDFKQGKLPDADSGAPLQFKKNVKSHGKFDGNSRCNYFSSSYIATGLGEVDLLDWATTQIVCQRTFEAFLLKAFNLVARGFVNGQSVTT